MLAGLLVVVTKTVIAQDAILYEITFGWLVFTLI